MEIFEFKKNVMLVKYLKDNVIKMLDKKNHAEIRQTLSSAYGMTFFNLINKNQDSVDIMIKSKSLMRVYNITVDGDIELKGERRIANAKKNS